MRNFSAVIGHGSWAQAWQTSVHVRTRDWNGACDERARMFPSMSARAASLFSSRAASMAALLEARRTSRRMGMSGRDAASSGSAGPSPRGRSVVDVGIITVAGRGSCPPAGTKLMCVGIITVAGGLGVPPAGNSGPGPPAAPPAARRSRSARQATSFSNTSGGTPSATAAEAKATAESRSLAPTFGQHREVLCRADFDKGAGQSGESPVRRQISRRHAWEGSPINGRLEPLRFGRKIIRK